MYNLDFENTNVAAIRDGLFGTVLNGCRSGVFIELENGEPAFAPFGYLKPGQRVFCTVLKKANECFRTLVAIDSICYEIEAA